MFDSLDNWLDPLVNATTIEELRQLWPVLSADVPELIPADGMEQPKEFHIHDVLTHIFYAVLGTPHVLHLRLAALFHDIGKPTVRAWNDKKNRWWFPGHPEAGARIAHTALTRLGFDPELRDRVVALVRRHDIMYNERWSDKAVKKLLAAAPLCDLVALSKADMMAQGGSHVPHSLAMLDKLIEHACRVTAGGKL